MQALGAVFGPGCADGERFAVGSAKTNLGHLELAAGMIGVIKVVLALEHEEIPPHLHLRQANPNLSLDRAGAIVPTVRTPWRRGGRRRIAGVSSFGASGINSHVVVKEAPAAPAQEAAAGEAGPEHPVHLLPLSARSDEALKELASAHVELLAGLKPPSLADQCIRPRRAALRSPTGRAGRGEPGGARVAGGGGGPPER